MEMGRALVAAVATHRPCRFRAFAPVELSRAPSRFTMQSQQAVQEFDTIQKLDAWMTTVLLHIKKSMDGDDVL